MARTVFLSFSAVSKKLIIFFRFFFFLIIFFLNIVLSDSIATAFHSLITCVRFDILSQGFASWRLHESGSLSLCAVNVCFPFLTEILISHLANFFAAYSHTLKC